MTSSANQVSFTSRFLAAAKEAANSVMPAALTATTAATAAMASTYFGGDTSQSIFAGICTIPFSLQVFNPLPSGKTLASIFNRNHPLLTGCSKTEVKEVESPAPSSSSASLSSRGVDTTESDTESERSEGFFSPLPSRSPSPALPEAGSDSALASRPPLGAVARAGRPRVMVNTAASLTDEEREARAATRRAKKEQGATVTGVRIATADPKTHPRTWTHQQVGIYCENNTMLNKALLRISEFFLLISPDCPKLATSLKDFGDRIVLYKDTLKIPVFGFVAIILYTLGAWLWAGMKGLYSWCITRKVKSEDPTYLKSIKDPYFKNGKWNLRDLQRTLNGDFKRLGLYIGKERILSFEQLVKKLGLGQTSFAENEVDPATLSEEQNEALEFLCCCNQTVFGSVMDSASEFFYGSKVSQAAVDAGYSIRNPKPSENAKPEDLIIMGNWPREAGKPDFVISGDLYVMQAEKRLHELEGKAVIENGVCKVELVMDQSVLAGAKRIQEELNTAPE